MRVICIRCDKPLKSRVPSRQCQCKDPIKAEEHTEE